MTRGRRRNDRDMSPSRGHVAKLSIVAKLQAFLLAFAICYSSIHSPITAQVMSDLRSYTCFAMATWATVLKWKPDEPEAGLAAVSRGAADGAQRWWPQTRAGDAGADGDSAGTPPALVARLCVGLTGLRLAVTHANDADDYRRECLACIVDTLLAGRRVVCELGAVAERRRLLYIVASDNSVLSGAEEGTVVTSTLSSPGAKAPGSSGFTSRRVKNLLSLS